MPFKDDSVIKEGACFVTRFSACLCFREQFGPLRFNDTAVISSAKYGLQNDKVFQYFMIFNWHFPY